MTRLPLSAANYLLYMDVLGAEGTSVTVNGTRFTMFGGVLGTRDRGTAGELPRDFAYNDGSSAGVGIRLENIPSGTYTVNTWHYDPTFPGLVNVDSGKKEIRQAQWSK